MARKHRNSLADLHWLEPKHSTMESRLIEEDEESSAGRSWVKPLAFLAIFAIVGMGFAIADRSVGAQSNHDLAGISRTFLVSIANNDVDAALDVCAESADGQRILEAERRRVFGALSGAEAFDPQARMIKQHTLNRLRDELAEDGVRWDDIEPLALGGVRARVLESSLMKEPASLVWGHLYFSNNNRLFEIEVTAWQCGDQFIIADVWNWAPLSVAPSEVEAFAKARSRRFLQERKDSPDNTKIIRPRRVFLTI